MLFNSHIFIFVFLPVTLIGFFALGALRSNTPARAWLLLTSLVFYGWWGLPYLLLLLASVLANYAAGRLIQKMRTTSPAWARRLLVLCVVLNLGMLGWLKYATFVAGNIAALTGFDLAIAAVVLPLAISFYTFQQIAYVVDAYRGDAAKYGLLDYTLFVVFFPQLIAGPVVHHRDLIPQFWHSTTARFNPDNMATGIVFFVIGLLKKLAIADPVEGLATATFTSGGTPGALEAWLAVGAFTIGLYFDFSGYSDMAVGLARMFGLRLTYNFASPYQATSIIEFWRRWHMTLSRFLRDYVYIPLGGNRYGARRRHANLMLTMLLGGLWHGAAWTFVAWGALHGLYLLVNHAWNGAVARAAVAGRRMALPGPVAQGITLLAVMLAWVFFAAPDFHTALNVLSGLAGLNGIGPRPPVVGALVDVALGRVEMGLDGDVGFPALVERIGSLVAFGLGWLIVLFAPNSQEIVDGIPHQASRWPTWPHLRFQPSVSTAIATAAGLIFAVTLMAEVKEFTYFQF